MILRVSPSRLSGEVQAPPSKSVMQRLLAASLLADGETWIHNPSESDDCTFGMATIAGLGAEIELGESAMRIRGTHGQIQPRQSTLELGESGLGMRLFGFLASLSPTPLHLHASGSLAQRPMETMVDMLNRMGANARWQSEGPEAGLHIIQNIQAPRTPISIDGSVSSQFLTGLLMTLPMLRGTQPIALEVNQLKSRPYVEMTIEILEDFGIHMDVNPDFTRIEIPLNQRYKGGFETHVDGDWSGAAALLVAGMLAADEEITVDGLSGTYTQADEAIRGALLFAGGAMSGTEFGVKVARRPVRAFSIDLTDSPDLFPVLTALAAFGNKPSHMKGLHRLQHKESSRGVILQKELAKCGIDMALDTDRDELIVHPCQREKLKPARIDAHGDHRIAMAAALIGIAGAPIEIQGAECVAKSYPAFFDDLEHLRGQIAWVSKNRS